MMLKAVVKGLERRFPNHNGPFEYGTRLAEETGELIEAIYEVKDGVMNEPQKEHLVKELQDVLRVAYGIVGLYDLTKKLPLTLAEITTNKLNPRDPIDYIVQIGVGAGELASAVNHVEGMGVKNEKHGDQALDHVLEKANNLVQVVVWVVRFFDCQDALDNQIIESYDDYKVKGFIR